MTLSPESARLNCGQSPAPKRAAGTIGQRPRLPSGGYRQTSAIRRIDSALFKQSQAEEALG